MHSTLLYSIGVGDIGGWLYHAVLSNRHPNKRTGPPRVQIYLKAIRHPERTLQKAIMILGSLATVLFVASSVSGLPPRYEDLSRRSADMSASAASSGCGSATAWQFDTSNHANVTMEDRSFLVHIPAAYNANTPHAVVLSFHGFQEDDLNQEMISGLSEKGLKLNGKVRVDH